jgi:hypothetical protein
MLPSLTGAKGRYRCIALRSSKGSIAESDSALRRSRGSLQVRFFYKIEGQKTPHHKKDNDRYITQYLCPIVLKSGAQPRQPLAMGKLYY